MTIDIFQLVKSSTMFATLDDAALHHVISQFTKVYLPKNKTLFQQGDLSDGLYIVVSGKLAAMVKTPSHVERFIGDINPGETIGEMGAISHEPRAAAVKAVRSAILLKLSAEQFYDLCQQYPLLMAATMRNVMHRSRSLIELLSSPGASKKHIVVLPANNKAQIGLFAQEISQLQKSYPEIAILSVHDKSSHVNSLTEEELTQHIDELQRKRKKIVYVLCIDDGAPLTKIGLEKANMVYVVANADGKPMLKRAIQQKIHKVDLAYRTKPELIVLHEKPKALPRRTEAWLKTENFGLCHHVRVTEAKDWHRILRFISGKAVGVVLGGGGVRSWAHLGALKAIEEAGLPIDVIGGTSAGSIVAGHYALNETWQDLHAKLRMLSGVTRDSVSWWNLTWPVASLFNGCAYTDAVQSIYGKVRIENLWRNFFCVTCDLNKGIEVVNRKGVLWRKIRASTSVPGVFPPMVLNGRLQLDGGIVNNLPVDTLKKLSDGIGVVIAVQLVHNVKEDKDYKFPPALPFWRVLLTKLRIIHRDYRFPHFIETFLRALLVGSSVKQRECAAAADVLVSPDLSEFSLLSVTEAQEKQLMDIGYKAAQQAIKKWQKAE